MVRNGTDEPVWHVQVTATARVDGELVAVGQQEGDAAPFRLAPGEFAMTSLFFNRAEISASATIETDVRSEAEEPSTPVIDLEILDATRQGDTVIGIVRNPSDAETGTTATLAVGCFSASGDMTGFARGIVLDAYTLPPGDDGPFQVGVPGDVPCETFLVAVSTDSG
jgi:hypothetical protein